MLAQMEGRATGCLPQAMGAGPGRMGARAEGHTPDRLWRIPCRHAPPCPRLSDRRPAFRLSLSAARVALDARPLHRSHRSGRSAGPAQIELLLLMFADGVSSHG